MHGRNETRNAIAQAIEFDPSCSGQAHSNRFCADPRNEYCWNTLCPMSSSFIGSADAKLR